MTNPVLCWDDIAHQDISDWVHRNKYSLWHDGTLETPIDTYWRVAQALFPDDDEYKKRLFEIMQAGRAYPGGRVLANAGTGRNTTLFNCFVSPTVFDDMSSIFDCLKVAALTQQQGGGIGMDFSNLRPGADPAHNVPAALVRGVGASASGPLSFMDVWDAMCRTIMSAGSRRGAMMATLRCDHPNIEAFIEAKRDPARLRMFNVSVLVTDAFMSAVRDDSLWTLKHEAQPVDFDVSKLTEVPSQFRYKEVSARALWDKIMRATYDCAEPGVIFIDRVNALNNLTDFESISATNPCGEQPLPPNGNCNLAAVNLAACVTKPGLMDYALLAETTAMMVRAADRVVDVSRYPTEGMAHEAKLKRRTGVGIMGLGTALQMVGLQYDSDRARETAQRWMKHIACFAYQESLRLAKVYGPCRLLADQDNRNKFAERCWLGHEFGLIEDIRKHGLRNAVILTVAPTGTTAMLARNVTSGIEPPFSLQYKRTVTEADGSKTVMLVEDPGAAAFARLHDAVPDHVVTAQNMSPRAHVLMQAAVQQYVDSSISKTINVPAGISFDDFKEVYSLAYSEGCKGCTTHRPNDVSGAVLEAVDTEGVVTPPPAPENASSPPQNGLARPYAAAGTTYKVRWPEDEAAYYVTCCGDGVGSPIEIFVATKDKSRDEYLAAITRLVSAVYRVHGRGDASRFVARELQEISDSTGGGWVKLGTPKSVHCRSRVAMLGRIIEDYVHGQGGHVEYDHTDIDGEPERRRGSRCPACGADAFVRVDGCWSCDACGYTNCE